MSIALFMHYIDINGNTGYDTWTELDDVPLEAQRDHGFGAMKYTQVMTRIIKSGALRGVTKVNDFDTGHTENRTWPRLVRALLGNPDFEYTGKFTSSLDMFRLIQQHWQE